MTATGVPGERSEQDGLPKGAYHDQNDSASIAYAHALEPQSDHLPEAAPQTQTYLAIRIVLAPYARLLAARHDKHPRPGSTRARRRDAETHESRHVLAGRFANASGSRSIQNASFPHCARVSSRSTVRPRCTSTPAVPSPTTKGHARSLGTQRNYIMFVRSSAAFLERSPGRPCTDRP